MLINKTWLLAVLVIFSLTVCAVTQSDAQQVPPLPEDVKIIPPASDLRKDIAAFSGKWMGTIKGIDRSGATYTFDAILVVEEIHDTWAQVIWSVGGTPMVKAQYNRKKSEVVSNPIPKIVMDFPKAKLPDMSFEMKDSNTLEATRNWGGGITETSTLKRAN